MTVFKCNDNSSVSVSILLELSLMLSPSAEMLFQAFCYCKVFELQAQIFLFYRE